MTRDPVYGQPKDQWGRVMGTMSVDSPRQAMLMEAILIEAMKRYAGRPEETLLAKWHGEIVYMQDRAAKGEWRGWEDDYPVEPRDRPTQTGIQHHPLCSIHTGRQVNDG